PLLVKGVGACRQRSQRVLAGWPTGHGGHWYSCAALYQQPESRAYEWPAAVRRESRPDWLPDSTPDQYIAACVLRLGHDGKGQDGKSWRLWHLLRARYRQRVQRGFFDG